MSDDAESWLWSICSLILHFRHFADTLYVKWLPSRATGQLWKHMSWWTVKGGGFYPGDTWQYRGEDPEGAEARRSPPEVLWRPCWKHAWDPCVSGCDLTSDNTSDDERDEWELWKFVNEKILKVSTFKWWCVFFWVVLNISCVSI